MINPRRKIPMDHSRVTDRILLLLAITLFIWILVHKSCNDSGGGGQSDTVYVQGSSDTVIIHDTTFKEVIKPVPYKVYHGPDSGKVINSPELSIISGQLDLTCDTIRVYIDSIEDGTCKVIVKDSIRGELLGWSAELYSKSMTITRVDTMKITTIPDRLRIAIGMGYSNQPFPYVNLSRGRLNGIAGYQIKDKSLLLGVGFQIR